jgi:hypothetical protein
MTSKDKGSLLTLRRKKYEQLTEKKLSHKEVLEERIKRAEIFLHNAKARWVNPTGDIEFDSKKIIDPLNAAVYRQLCSDLYKLEMEEIVKN